MAGYIGAYDLQHAREFAVVHDNDLKRQGSAFCNRSSNKDGSLKERRLYDADVI